MKKPGFDGFIEIFSVLEAESFDLVINIGWWGMVLNQSLALDDEKNSVSTHFGSPHLQRRQNKERKERNFAVLHIWLQFSLIFMRVKGKQETFAAYIHVISHAYIGSYPPVLH